MAVNVISCDGSDNRGGNRGGNSNTGVEICTSGVFPLVIKACRDLADIEARIKFLGEKFSNGGPLVVLAAMKKHSNTNSVTLSLALRRGSSPNKPPLRRAPCQESSAHVRKTECTWL